MSRFQDVSVFRQDRISLGIDTQTQQTYLSIPVSNGLVDYDEYYVVPPDWARNPTEHWTQITKFADDCRHQREDDKLILKPGSNRGVAF